MNRSLTFSYLEEYWVRIFFSPIIDSLTEKFFLPPFLFLKKICSRDVLRKELIGQTEIGDDPPRGRIEFFTKFPIRKK